MSPEERRGIASVGSDLAAIVYPVTDLRREAVWARAVRLVHVRALPPVKPSYRTELDESRTSRRVTYCVIGSGSLPTPASGTLV